MMYGCAIGEKPTADDSACEPCPAGLYSHMKSEYCHTCLPNYIIELNSPGCITPCPDGKVPNESKTFCDPCPAGTYKNNGVCEDCGHSTYQSSAESMSCDTCPIDTYHTLTGSTDVADCFPCPAGQTSKADHSGCEDCAPGKFSATSGATCDDCVLGYYSTSSASTSCQQCPDHNYLDLALGATSCTPCPTGTFATAPAVSASACVPTCGDGLKAGSEACDDGILGADDGCDDTTCTVNTGWSCTGGGPSTASTCSTVCGDGIRVVGKEDCDDGIITPPADGCDDTTCTENDGWSCTGGSISAASTCMPVCGDGKRVVGIEDCDDGTLGSPDDGCDDTSCTVNDGWSCTGGDLTTASTCTPICGDSKVVIGKEDCDDGVLGSPNDGCDDTACTVNVGWSCTGGDISNPSTCEPICGDGLKVIPNEDCDDGDLTIWDGCDDNCNVEQFYECLGGDITGPDTCQIECGDGFRYEPDETCDDGNTAVGDGCDDSCQTEALWVCEGGNLASQDSCSDICGDGFRIFNSGTNCDDGNFISGDGCDPNCEIEYGWACSGGSATSADSCSTICNDGVIISSHEQCDDKNQVSGDGCDSSCQIEIGYSCPYDNFLLQSVCHEICGDGLNVGVHACDDGNLSDGDGCDSSCNVEPKFQCSGGSSTTRDVCDGICGDGFQVGTEQCDDGNGTPNDGCTSCSIDPNHICTDGSFTSSSTCSVCPINYHPNESKTECVPICGDSVIVGSEECDDGNQIEGDGCSNECQVEQGWACTKDPDTAERICEQVDITPTATTRTAQVSVATTAGASVSSSSFNYHSPQGLWLTLGFNQMVSLLQLSIVTFPEEIRAYFLGIEILISPVNLLQIDDFPGIRAACNWIGKPVDNFKLELLNVESTSAFVSNISMLFVLFWVLTAGCVILCVKSCLWCRCERFKRISWCLKLYNFIKQLFWCSVFFRMLISEYMFIVLTSLSEIKRFEYAETHQKVSLGLACGLMVLCVGLLFYTIYKIYTNKKEYDPDRFHLEKELFIELRNENKSRLYPVLYMLKRLGFVAILIYSDNTELFPVWMVMLALCLLQVCYMVTVFHMWPFEDVTNNLFEIIFEMTYFILILILVLVNKEHHWNSKMTNTYLFLLVASGCIILFICCLKALYDFYMRFCHSENQVSPKPSQRSRNQEDGSNIDLNRNMQTNNMHISNEISRSRAFKSESGISGNSVTPVQKGRKPSKLAKNSDIGSKIEADRPLSPFDRMNKRRNGPSKYPTYDEWKKMNGVEDSEYPSSIISNSKLPLTREKQKRKPKLRKMLSMQKTGVDYRRK